MRTARNIAIVLLLALIVAAVPGGSNAADAVFAALTICFLAVIGLAGYMLFRQNRFTYDSLDDRHRGALLGAVGAIVLIIAGTDELLDSSAGTLIWLAVLAGSIFALYRVWIDARSY
jgi:hypothetical protein